MTAVAVSVAVACMLFTATLFIYLGTPRGKGRFGEWRVRRIIGRTKKGKRYVINDFMFVCGGKSVQIDHIVINKNGVYVIETKNYSGTVYGTDAQKYWLQVLPHGRGRKRIYSPVKQNAAHIYRLAAIFPFKVYFTSIVVFVQNNTKKLTSSTAVPISVLKKRLALPQKPKPYTESEMERLYLALKEAQTEEVSLENHISVIKKARELIEHNICPVCQAPLVTRKNEYGEFFGCSRYPECTYIKRG